MLGLTGRLLQDCVHEIERMQVSEGGGGEVRLLPHLPVVGYGAESATRLLLPRKLLGETAAGVAALDSTQCAWAEAHPASVLTGVLTVLGRPLAALEGWANVQRQMGDDLLQEVATFDASARGRARMWAESLVATQGLTSAEVVNRGSTPSPSPSTYPSRPHPNPPNPNTRWSTAGRHR